MTRSLKMLCLALLGSAVISGSSTGAAMAQMMEIDITYYSDAAHSVIVGEYYKGCDGKVRMVGSYSDFYDYVSSPCDPIGPPLD